MAEKPDPRKTPRDGRVRVVIDRLAPMVDAGRFPAKRIAGEPVCIEADCFTDGHDQLGVVLIWRPAGAAHAHEIDMLPQGNDLWTAEFTPSAPGRYECTVLAWVDHFESWRKELERREELADIRIALLVGSALVSQTAARAGRDAPPLEEWARLLRDSAGRDSTADASTLKALALDPERARLMRRHCDRGLAESASLEIHADRKRAGFSSWYELFPRSASSQARPAREFQGRRGTFALRRRDGL